MGLCIWVIPIASHMLMECMDKPLRATLICLVLLSLTTISIAGPGQYLKKDTPRRKKLFVRHFVVLAIVYAIYVRTTYKAIFQLGDSTEYQGLWHFLVSMFYDLWLIIMYFGNWTVTIGINAASWRVMSNGLQELEQREQAEVNAEIARQHQKEVMAAQQQAREEVARKQAEAKAARQRNQAKWLAKAEAAKQAKIRRGEQLLKFWDLALGPKYGADSSCRGLIDSSRAPVDFEVVISQDKKECREKKRGTPDIKIYFLDKELQNFYSDTRPQIWVDNDSWAKTIEGILGAAGLYQDLVQKEMYEAPRLSKLSSTDTPLHDIFGLPSSSRPCLNGQYIKADFVQSLGQSVSTRGRELNSLFAERIK